jgi:hypothetical protein
MKTKVQAEYIKSVDPDYQGQQQYHIGEKIKIFNPDNPNFEHNNKEGTWQGVAKNSVLKGKTYHYVELSK